MLPLAAFNASQHPCLAVQVTFVLSLLAFLVPVLSFPRLQELFELDQRKDGVVQTGTIEVTSAGDLEAKATVMGDHGEPHSAGGSIRCPIHSLH